MWARTLAGRAIGRREAALATPPPAAVRSRARSASYQAINPRSHSAGVASCWPCPVEAHATTCELDRVPQHGRRAHTSWLADTSSPRTSFADRGLDLSRARWRRRCLFSGLGWPPFFAHEWSMRTSAAACCDDTDTRSLACPSLASLASRRPRPCSQGE